MLRCFDCNVAAADVFQHTQDGSWLSADTSKTNSDPPVTSQQRTTFSSEYRLKFRPFSDYSYVDGHFSSSSNTTATATATAVAAGGASGRDAPDGAPGAGPAAAGSPATPWYEEVVELRRKASSYKVRGWGREMAEPHLVQFYNSKEEDPTSLAERKIISALYLETLKPPFVREERGRSPTTTGGAGHRQQSHPPPSSRKSPGAPKMALKLHTEGGRRPHSAQPSTERSHGDAVDKGRSAVTPRTPTSKPGSTVSTTTTTTAVAAAKTVRKRPSTERPPQEKTTTPRELPRGGSSDSRHHPRPGADKTDRSARPAAAKQTKSVAKPDKAAARPPPDSSSGTPESGKGIRGGGGTPRSRSAQKLAGKAKSPTKEDKSVTKSAMTSSAPVADDASRSPTQPAERNDQKAKPEATHTPPPTQAAQPIVTDDDLRDTTGDGTEQRDSRAEDESASDVVRSAPEPTRVKSPDGMAPIKSPEPVNWTVPLDTGKTFTVTQNVIGHGSPQSSRADSLRSPGEESARSPYQRAVTDVSHLRNGDISDSPLTAALPAHTNGHDADGPAVDPAHTGDARNAVDSTTANAEDQQRSMHEESYNVMKRSLHETADPMTASMAGDELQKSFHGENAANVLNRSYHAEQDDLLQRSFHKDHDPMTASMTADDLKRSFQAEDPMQSSMAENELKRSLHEDPMTASMTGEDLKRSFHAADPMATSMTGDDLQRSFHGDGPPVPVSNSPPRNPGVPPHQPMASSYFSNQSATSDATDRSVSSSLFSSGSAEPASFGLFSSGSAQPTAPALFSAGAADPTAGGFSSGSATSARPAAAAVFSSSSAEPAAEFFSSGSAEPATGLFSSGSAEPAAGLFSSGSAEPAAGLFSSGSAGPARFSSDLFSSTGRQTTDAKPDAPKGTYRVI